MTDTKERLIELLDALIESSYLQGRSGKRIVSTRCVELRQEVIDSIAAPVAPVVLPTRYCPTCDGTGNMRDGPCNTCYGTGQITAPVAPVVLPTRSQLKELVYVTGYGDRSPETRDAVAAQNGFIYRLIAAGFAREDDPDPAVVEPDAIEKYCPYPIHGVNLNDPEIRRAVNAAVEVMYHSLSAATDSGEEAG